MSWSTGKPTNQGQVALTAILQAAQGLPAGPLKNMVLPYVQGHVADCEGNTTHPWGPPAGLMCQPPVNPNNHHGAFGDGQLTTSLVRAAARAQIAQTAAQWCIVIFDLDHAGGGGDNKAGTSYLKKKAAKKGSMKKSSKEQPTKKKPATQTAKKKKKKKNP